MKRWFAVLLVLLVAGSARAEWKGLTGSEAPPLEVKKWAKAGDGAGLPDYRGRVVVVAFFTPSNPTILGAVPRLEELRFVYGGKGLEVLAVTLDPEASLDSFIDKQQFPFPCGRSKSKAYGDGAGPRAYVVAPDGKVAWEGAPNRIPDGPIVAAMKRAKRFSLRRVDAAADQAAKSFRKGLLSLAESQALEAEGKDSEYVLKRLEGLRQYWQRDAADAEKAGDQVRAADRYQLIVKHFKGTPDETRAAKALAALLADGKAKKEIAAHKAYGRLYTEWVRAEGKPKKIKGLVKKVATFIRKHDGTRAAAYAKAMKARIEGDPALTEMKAFIESQRIDTSGSGWRTKLPEPPTLTFGAGRSYFWELTTNKGAIRIRFMPQVAPKHVSSTIYLTQLGFYDGLIFHRVIPNFMAQGGCPNGNGGGSPGYSYKGEFSPNVKHDRGGLLSMANAGPGTDGSQFFLTFSPQPHLDGKHTIFGEVVSGMETLKALEQCGSESGATSERLVIESAKVTFE